MHILAFSVYECILKHIAGIKTQRTHKEMPYTLFIRSQFAIHTEETIKGHILAIWKQQIHPPPSWGIQS